MNTTQNLKMKSMTKLLFDLESTGLLRQGSQIHCVVVRDINDAEMPIVFDHKPERTIEQGIKELEAAEFLIGHNIINYDIPLIQERFPEFAPKAKLVDTLVLSRIYYANISERDYQRRPAGMPQRLYGRHSLEAWGHRLRCFKGDFGKHDGAWDTYTPEMLDYCIQDTEVTLKLYELMLRRMAENPS